MSQEEIKNESKKQSNFIRDIIDEDLKSGKHKTVHTRFPPEPNGYLHIGHAKSICLNFGLAIDYKGLCNLRFDDTNPTKEEQEYVDSIKEDIRWLGFDWEDREYYASDYFDQLYEYAIKLIKKGKAYVDSLNADQIKELRGTPTEPGKESPFRNRSVEENLDLFVRMKNGDFKEGEHVLRAKIDMASSNLNLRDPVMYRVLHKSHHRTGNKWCIYPMYDWAHGQSDSIERITHSLCTLEFENHRPLYDWFVQELEIYPPRQIEFARLNLSYTIMSKRKLLALVEKKFVDGWDDPRMPTISGLRRRGYTPESIRNFSDRVGIAKRENTIDVSLLEFSVREDLNIRAKRVMAVLNPLKIVITNYPDNQTEELEAINKFLPMIEIKQYGLDCFIINEPEEKDFIAANIGIEEMSKIIHSGNYDLVIMDELNIALYYKLIDLNNVLEILRNKPKHVEIIITGRYAPSEIIEIADLVTEMKEVKHYYNNGVQARTGIEM